MNTSASQPPQAPISSSESSPTDMPIHPQDPQIQTDRQDRGDRQDSQHQQDPRYLQHPIQDLNAAQDQVTAAQASFIPVMRELARTYQAFTAYTDSHVRQLGLTPPQFDVIATLGNTEGMTMNYLAERTLVTKGTLTGIVDRLEQKGLVKRQVPPENRRCFRVVLTPAGEEVFRQTFPAHLAHLKQRFDQLSPEDLQLILNSLQKLHAIFSPIE